VSRPDDAFLAQLRATFRAEAEEQVNAVESGLEAIGAARDAEWRPELVETVFRAVHSLKGAARSVGLGAIEAFCQLLEEEFARWKREGGAPPPGDLDQARSLLGELDAALRAMGGGARAASADEPAPRAAAEPDESVRVSLSRLAGRLAAAEEMLTVKLRSRRIAEELQSLGDWFHDWRRQWQRVEPAALTGRRRARAAGAALSADDADALLRFLDWNLDQVQRLQDRVEQLAREAGGDRRHVGRLVDELLHESKTLLLSPFATITRGMRRLVDDLALEEGKQVELAVHGEEVEIDRRVLQEIKDPLIHLLRNAIDHGIEPPGERTASGKPARASIVLEIARLDAGKIALRLADDGRGLDLERVKRAAVAQGLLAAKEAESLDDAHAAELVFRGGFTTAPGITRVSGRGLGLAIVREKVERLGGAVSIASRPGGGTRVEMLLPTTLATIRGVLVEAGGLPFVIPGVQVERVALVDPADVRSVEGREAVAIGARTVALAELRAILELPDAAPAAEARFPVVVVGQGEQRVAFAVDEVVEELEVLAKPLLPPLKRVRNVSGATVLASGRIAPILNVADLVKSARRGAPFRAAGAVPAAPPAAKGVLIAEDSITSRMLLKGLLESAGYRVRTASDGMEALLLLRSDRFDVVISDVDMPRLDGFGLTQRIRADARTAALPVILVTTVDTDASRERGIDAGANAYVVKSRLDQADLLDAVRRLAGAAGP
jgi:two-component system chemotaxis sensor kinase CheA